ncbi:MAG: response regulator, partial [Chloroflexi bacterium]|nr:response regulator [Chloroflexota bacterium]
MSRNDPKDKLSTRHLHMPPEEVPHPRVTGPLDRTLPWVIEFRVVGTASIIQAQVEAQMILGRVHSGDSEQPHIDLSPYDAFASGVSRHHALILTEDEHLMLQDLGSTNGTRLNGAVCDPARLYRLRHGDEIMLGRLRMQVYFAVVPVQDGYHTSSAYHLPADIDIPLMGSGQHILVIEDDADVGVVFRMALEKAGFNVTLVDNAAKGLGAFFQAMPDAIILDLMLPDMNGLDLVRYVRKQPLAERVPLLVVSGATAGFQMNQAMQAGADLFLGKPVAVEELVRAVGTAVAQ